MSDDFFSDLANIKPFFKAAFEGFAGSGKTYTAAQVVLGLYRRIDSTKPVVIFDTEMAAKFLKPMFDEAGIKVLVRNSRSLADLKETMRRCREGLSDFLLIDSISHVWEMFVEAYKKRTGRASLRFEDWGLIKPTWKAEFSDPFVRDPYHCVMTGRAAYEYSDEKNAETGKREIFKSGIKMKVEGETAYEPDILVLMERFEEVLGADKRVWREATIIKDRSTLIDGKTFKNPTFGDFAPALDLILKDPAKVKEARERDAGALVHTEEDKRRLSERKRVALDKVESLLVEKWAGQTKDEKQKKVGALRYAYGTVSWAEVQGWSAGAVETGIPKIERYIAADGDPAAADAMGSRSPHGGDDLPEGFGAAPPPIDAAEAAEIARKEAAEAKGEAA